MTHLIDTPEIFRVITTLEDGDPLLEAIKRVSDEGTLFVSVVSHGEVMSQISRMEDKALSLVASQNYKQFIASIGTKRLVDFDEPVAVRWSNLTARFTAEDYPDATSEALMVAASANFFGYTLICGKQNWHEHLPEMKFEYV